MELKRLISHFTYRIEPKPEGGFIAHATDPSVPPLEAPTRVELQQKIQAAIMATLATEFPGLKVPINNNKVNLAFHIERKPGGGFSIESTGGNAPSIAGATHAEIENPFLEKLVAAMGKHFMPELSQALGGQLDGKIQVFVNQNAGGSSGAPSLTSGDAGQILPPVSIQAGFARSKDALKPSSNSLLTPEANGAWPIIRFLLAVLIIGAVIYFFRHH